MSGENHDTNPVEPSDDARWLNPGLHPNAAPGTETGIYVDTDGVTALRSPWYRTHDPKPYDLPQAQDTIAMIDGIVFPSPPDHQERMIGLEGEMFVIDLDSGDTVPAYGVGVEELHTSQIEANSLPFTTPERAVYSLLENLAEFNKTLARTMGRVAIDPASALMHRAPTAEDVRWSNQYIHREVELHPEFAKFMGAGIHMHVDVPTESAATIANYLRLVAQYMNLPMQSAPFAFGETVPRLGEAYEEDAYKPHDGNPVQSVRYLARQALLDFGGVGAKVAHYDNHDALEYGETRMIRRESNHPARIYGGHADIRIRFDAVDETMRDGTARIEVCVFDTGAYRFDTVVAVTDFLKAVASSLESYVSAGEKGMEELHNSYPELFGKMPGTEALTDNLYRAETNSIAMSYGGFDATITDYSGKVTTAKKIFNQLYKFATQGGGMHTPSLAYKGELEKASYSRTVTEAIIRNFSANHSEPPSLRGYYTSGFGTPADWMRIGDEARKELGVSESKRWRLAAEDRALSLGTHLNNITGLMGRI